VGPVESESAAGGSNILIAYFSYAENAELPDDVDTSSSASIQMWNGEVTGNTGVIAHMIAETTGGDLSPILTVEKYPSTYDETIDVGQSEKEDGIYPELASQIKNLDSYDTIFLGFPNWWGGMPMVMYSFLNEYDLSDKMVIPFCTSGGSGFSGAISEIQEAEPEATVVTDGLSIGDGNVMNAEEDVAEWVNGLGFAG